MILSKSTVYGAHLRGGGAFFRRIQEISSALFLDIIYAFFVIFILVLFVCRGLDYDTVCSGNWLLLPDYTIS